MLISKIELIWSGANGFQSKISIYSLISLSSSFIVPGKMFCKIDLLLCLGEKQSNERRKESWVYLGGVESTVRQLLVWVLFSVVLIFCVISFGDHNFHTLSHPFHAEWHTGP